MPRKISMPSSLPGSGQKKSRSPIQTTKKQEGYVAGSADATKILSIGADSSTAVESVIPSKVEITNTGKVPAVAILVCEAYEDEN